MLKVNGISKAFAGRAAVSDVSFEIRAGETVGFVGPNGAGKSTTMKVICGLLRADSGTVRLNGNDLRHSRRAYLAQLGALLESPAFYPSLTALDHIAFLARMRGFNDRAHFASLLERVGLSPDSRKPLRQFSMGMKQRLGIAMAMLHSPRLLVLDEPMNGLDPAAVVKLRGLMGDLSRESGVALLVSSHILSEIEQICDRVIFIKGGRLIQDRTLGGAERAESVRLWLRTGDDARAMEVLHGLEFVSDVSRRPGGIECTAVARELARIPAALVHAQVEIYEFSPLRENLESVYLTEYGSESPEALE